MAALTFVLSYISNVDLEQTGQELDWKKNVVYSFVHLRCFFASIPFKTQKNIFA